MDKRDDSNQRFSYECQTKCFEEWCNLRRYLRTESVRCILSIALGEHLVYELCTSHLHVGIEECYGGGDEADESTFEDGMLLEYRAVPDFLGCARVYKSE